MSFNPGLITVEDEDNPPIYLYFRIGAQPTLIVPALTQALAVGRRGLDSLQFVTRIIAAIGLRSIRESSLLIDKPRIPLRWTYEIRIDKPLEIIACELSEGGEPTLLYRGTLDHFLTKELRKPSRRPNRRDPRGYASKEEYLKSLKPERHPRLTEEILHERAQADAPHVNLSGVRVFTKEEALARGKAERKRLRDASREKKIASSRSFAVVRCAPLASSVARSNVESRASARSYRGT
jgi:hypothetical protein